MNASVETLLEDAKRLVERLKNLDVDAEKLTEQAVMLETDVTTRNEYMENLTELNKVAGHKPRSKLILGMQRENCFMRSLQMENAELRRNLGDYETALELIMTKYRQQLFQFQNCKNSLHTIRLPDSGGDSLLTASDLDHSDKISEMAAVMQEAINIDDEYYLKREDYISKLTSENHRLRDLLLITSDHFDNDDAESEDQSTCLSSAPSQEQLTVHYDSS